MPARDADVDLMASLQAVQDISAVLQRRADALAAQRQRAFELFEFAPDACVMTDAQDRIMQVNDAARKLLSLESTTLRRRRIGPVLRLRKDVAVRSVRDVAGGKCWHLAAQP
jgi:PAS domain-containing protein